MSLPDFGSLEALSLAELRGLVGVLIAEVRRLQSDNAILRDKVEAQQATITSLQTEKQALRDEVARLKGLPPRPPIRPSGMEKATEPGVGIPYWQDSHQKKIKELGRQIFLEKGLARLWWVCLNLRWRNLVEVEALAHGAALRRRDHTWPASGS